MLDKLRSEDFARYLNEKFYIQAETVGPVEAELIAVDKLGAEDPSGREAGRRPFSLVFRTRTDIELPQKIYTIEHGEMGALDIFIAPIGPDDVGMRYEAVFA